MKWISIWRRLLDFISPRTCVICGRRLSATEEVLCMKCHFHLPRTGFWLNPYDNEMAKSFWHLIPIERAAAYFYYEAHSDTVNMIYQLKYKDHPEVGVILGRMLAKEMQGAGFFDGIDGIVPVPLAKKRLRQRGYNQSDAIAQGISKITGLPVLTDVVRRVDFVESQTKKSRWSRAENVEQMFALNQIPAGAKHLLVIDDVVTTGATVTACAKQIAQNGGIKISVLALGYTKR